MPGATGPTAADGDRHRRGRAVVLLTGMSGAGKTTALRALAARGHRVVDTDDDGWSVVVPHPDEPAGWEQLWDAGRIGALLDGHRDGTLFVAGTVANQGAFADRFDAVVLLTAPLDVLLARIDARTDNPYGKDARERAAVVQHVATVEPLLRRAATHVVGTDRPAAEVADLLEAIASGRALPVRGERCLLRPGRPDDEGVLRQWLRPHHEWHRWDGPYLPRPTDAEAERYARSVASQPDDDGAGLPPRVAVVADPADGRLLGTVSWYWESEATAWARMGIVLHDPAVRGRGVGREALALWTSYLFARTDWVRLDLATWSGNHGMVAVARALGFVEEGRFRRARVVDGVRHDAVVYGVLREEWASAPR